MSEHPVNDYALRVVREVEVAGPLVRGACRRHLDDLDHGHLRGLRFSEDKADHAMHFFPTVLRLNAGEFNGEPFVLHPSQEFIVGSLFGWLRAEDSLRRFRVAYIEMGKGSGKSLDIDTPIATPYGWKAMGDIVAGDQVFDEYGKPCNVIAAHPVRHDRDCYAVEFSDGETIVADAEHLWKTSALRSAGKKGPKPKHLPRKGQYAIRTTADIAATVKPFNYKDHPTNIQAKWNHRVDVAGPLEFPYAELPIAPYTLGAWLGDGDSRSGIFTGQDYEIFDNLVEDGYEIQSIKSQRGTSTLRVRLRGLTALIKDNNLFCNKHIPEQYFRASIAQRLDLLCGISDTDGYICKSGRCEITLCNRVLAMDVLALIRSLGMKSTVTESDACLNGVVVNRRWRIKFQTYKDFPTFRLHRKVARLRDPPKTRSLSCGRMIVRCERVPSVPVRCISVDSPSQMYLCGKTLIPTHNSPLLAGIGLYGIVGDREPMAEIFSAAAKKEQAMILFRHAVGMVNKSPALSKRFKKSGKDPHVWNLFDPVTNSFFRPIAAEGAQSGPNVHMGLVDELHEHKSPLVMSMMSAGRKSRRQPLVIAITNSGFDKTSVCWEYHDKAAGVCTRGDIDDTFFAYACTLDDGEDPLVDERCWKKANPTLGTIITEQYLRDEVVAARSMPSKESSVRRLNFCQWTQADNPLIAGHVWEAAGGGGTHGKSTFNLATFKGAEVILGLDLSAVSDLTAAMFVIRKEGKFYWWPEFWIPEGRLKEKIDKDKVPYDIWLREGHVRTTPGNSINLDFVVRDLKKIVKDNGLNVVEIAYDRWKIEEFIAACDRADWTDINMVEFGQGYQSMGPAVDSLEKSLRDEQIVHNKNPCLRWNAANAVVVENAAGWRKFDKSITREKRIDGLIAGTMAHHRASLLPEAPPTYTIRWAD